MTNYLEQWRYDYEAFKCAFNDHTNHVDDKTPEIKVLTLLVLADKDCFPYSEEEIMYLQYEDGQTWELWLDSDYNTWNVGEVYYKFISKEFLYTSKGQPVIFTGIAVDAEDYSNLPLMFVKGSTITRVQSSDLIQPDTIVAYKLL